MQYDVGQALEILGRTPNVLSALLDDLYQGWLVGDEGDATWSPMSVVAHLVHGERTDWITRARTIIEKGEAEVFEPFERFAHLEEARTRSIADLLAEFAALRHANGAAPLTRERHSIFAGVISVLLFDVSALAASDSQAYCSKSRYGHE